MGTTILVILIALLLSAFFSGMEIAFLSSNKLRLEIERKQHPTYGRIASLFLKAPGQYISTILVGNNIALVVYSIFMSLLYTAIAGRSNYAAETLISTLIIIFTAEFLPKAVVRANPNFYLRTFAVPLYVFYILFYPISKFATLLSTGLLRLMGRRVEETPQITEFGKVDLATLVEEAAVGEEGDAAEREDSEQRVRLFQNALDFSEQRVRECMVPRTEMEAIEVGEGVDDLRRMFVGTGFSRLPVYDGTIDNIIGYANLKSLFDGPKTIREVLQETLYVPETMSQRKLLEAFTRSNKSLAVVIDEFGGTAGIISLEDILEQIFGEIEDEHDSPDLTEKQLSDKEWVLSCRLEVKYLNEKYGLGIEESREYDTLAGFVIYHYEGIPAAGEVVTVGELEVKILRTTRSRIELARVRRI